MRNEIISRLRDWLREQRPLGLSRSQVWAKVLREVAQENRDRRERSAA